MKFKTEPVVIELVAEIVVSVEIEPSVEKLPLVELIVALGFSASVPTWKFPSADKIASNSKLVDVSSHLNLAFPAVPRCTSIRVASVSVFSPVRSFGVDNLIVLH